MIQRLMVTTAAAGLLMALAGCEEGRIRDRDVDVDVDRPRVTARPEIGGGRTETAAPTAPEAPQPETPPAGPGKEKSREMDARFRSIEGVKLDGKVLLKEQPGGVLVTVEVNDAPPGRHGVHVHEQGDCSDIPGKSMGQHFSPDAHAKHGLPAASSKHLGDLGNITVGDDGKGALSQFVAGATLAPGAPTSFAGRAVVVHQSEDSGRPDSYGQAISCGVIEERGLLD